MASRVTPDDRLDGWEAIAKYLGWTPRTVIRWEKQKGLPVHRVAGGKRQPVYAYRREIDFWFEQTGGARTIAISLPNEPEREPTLKSSSGLPGLRVSRRIQQTVAGIILLTATLGAAWRISTQPAIQITGVTQLTDDGTAKEHLVTDGRQLYFSEDIGDEKVLSTMAAGGGPIRRILLPISNPYPVDVSPDGRSLLVLSDEDREAEHRLWVVPAAGGPPHDMAGIRCRAAAWSPNGEWIAFGSGNAIYLVSRDGSQTRLLTRLAGVPATIRWSADGRHLFVVIGNLPANTTSLWQVSLSYFRGTNGGGGYLFGSESDAVRANFSRDFRNLDDRIRWILYANFGAAKQRSDHRKVRWSAGYQEAGAISHSICKLHGYGPVVELRASCQHPQRANASGRLWHRIFVAGNTPQAVNLEGVVCSDIVN